MKPSKVRVAELSRKGALSCKRQIRISAVLSPRSMAPRLFGAGTGFTEDNFSMDQSGGGMVSG